MDSFLHPCHHGEYSDGESRSRHSSASCNGCSDCEAADTLLSMRHFCGSTASDARKAAAIPPRLRSKQYRDNYFGDNTTKATAEGKAPVSLTLICVMLLTMSQFAFSNHSICFLFRRLLDHTLLQWSTLSKRKLNSLALGQP